MYFINKNFIKILDFLHKDFISYQYNLKIKLKFNKYMSNKPNKTNKTLDGIKISDLVTKKDLEDFRRYMIDDIDGRFVTKEVFRTEISALKTDITDLTRAMIDGFNKVFSLFDDERAGTVVRFVQVNNRIDDIADRYVLRTDHNLLAGRVSDIEHKMSK